MLALEVKHRKFRHTHVDLNAQPDIQQTFPDKTEDPGIIGGVGRDVQSMLQFEENIEKP